MKDDEVVSYLYGDQLGSVSAVADANGSQISRTLYHPWGTTRHTQGASPTDYAYTGQMQEGDIYFYNARWPKVPATQWRGYDPQLGRFMQADTFVPTSQGTQGFDRYAYVNNNPVNGTDPTGFSCIGPNCPQIVPIPTPPVSQEVLNINPASTATPLMIYPTPVLIPTPFYYHVAPPDFKNLLPDGNPPPPAVEGLSDEWTWKHPSGYPVIRTRVTQEQYGDQIREGPVKTRGKEKTPIGIVILNQTARRKKSIHLTRNGEGEAREQDRVRIIQKPASIILPI